MNTHQQPLHGRLEDVHFSELILTISQRKESGVLHVVRHRIEKDVYFHNGRIMFAKSNDPDDRLGELCLRSGKISYRHLDECAKKVVPGLRLGTILVQEGYLRASDLYQGVIHQVEEIVYSLFGWSDGTFEFRSGELPTKEVITLSISTPDIILSGINRVWRWSWIRDWIGPLDTVYVRKEDWNSSAKKMTVTPEIQVIMDFLEKPRSLEEILNTSSMTNFEICKLLWALLIIGVIQPGMPRSGTLQMPFEPEVTSDIFMIEPDRAEPAPWPHDDTPPLARQSAQKAPAVAVPVAESEAILETPVSQAEAQVRVEPSVETLVSSSDSKSFDAESVLITPSTAEQLAYAAKEAFFTMESPVTEASSSDALDSPEHALPQSAESVASGLLMESAMAAAPFEVSFSDLAEAQTTSEPLSVSFPEPLSDRWEQGIASDIKKFNEVQRFLFEMLRMELGPDIANFLERILNKASVQHPLIFDGVKMNEFGELDPGALESNIQGNLADRYSEALSFLRQEEREMMQSYLDRKRVEAIEIGLNRILEKQKLPS